MYPVPAPELLAPLPGWFSAHGRRLPWRAGDLGLPHPDPYAVLVSEVMLQQTQVVTVIPFFRRWMERFPDPRTLAQAEDDDVLKLWEGLGYYRRARFLKQAARIIAERGWPEDLGTLPGLGPYTSAAVAAIAFQRPEPALDGNAFRVLARLQGIPDDPRRHAAELREWLHPALSAHGPSRITQALMELGATLCSPQPACTGCPLAATCVALHQGCTDRIPPPAARAKARRVELWLPAIGAQGCWLLLEPAPKGLLAGLWRWPALEHAAGLEPRGPALALRAGTWQPWLQVYTHRKERVTPLAIQLAEAFQAPGGCRWIPEAELPALPLGKRDQRLRDLLGQPALAELAPEAASLLVRRILAGEAGR